jgi:hypothetical protein
MKGFNCAADSDALRIPRIDQPYLRRTQLVAGKIQCNLRTQAPFHDDIFITMTVTLKYSHPSVL